MQLKPFEAGRYDEETILIHNPANGKQDFFKEDEFEVVKFLKQNESQTLLALLLPNIGIAKKNHIVLCLKVVAKLKRLQIVDYFSITGIKPVSDTGTLELQLKKEPLQFHGANVFAAALFTFFQKIFSSMGTFPLLLLLFSLAGCAFIFFPYERLEAALSSEGLSYSVFFLTLYFTTCLAFSIRALMQAALIKALGREIRNPIFSLYPPFVVLKSEKTEINLCGFQGRIQMSLVGLVSPFLISAIFLGLALIGKISLLTAFAAQSACVGTTLILACPIFSFDVAQILHVLFIRRELNERISSGLKSVFQTKGSLRKEMLIALVSTFLWLLIWLDCLRTFWETLESKIVEDLYSSDLVLRAGASTMILCILTLLLTPFLVFVFSFLRQKIGRHKKRIVVNKERVKDSLSFEERMWALEKIPLFTYLNDQERLALLNEMQPMYFKDNAYMVHQGEVGKEFLVLVKGSANVIFHDVAGKSFHLADLQEGDAFGEIALIDDVPRTASIISDGGCIVLVLKKEGFDRFAEILGSPDRVKTLIRLSSFFRRHPLFSKLSAKDQANLIDRFNFLPLTVGEEVRNAEIDENFYVIYSGKLRVDTGDDSTDTLLESDDCFGYANALNAKYFAVEGTGLLCVRNVEFHKLIWEKLVEKPELFI